MDNFETVFEEMNTELKKLRNEIHQRSTDLLKKAFAQFFKDNPNVYAFGWKQYTPYFNDGEPCVFQSSADYGWATNCSDLSNIDLHGEWTGDDDTTEFWVDNPDYGDFNGDSIPSATSQALNKFRRLLSKVDEGVLLDLFGDHVSVVATKNGFDIEEFDHD